MERLEKLMQESPNTLLCHYTTLSGLIGIVDSKCIWASSMHYLNDSAELKHAFSLIQAWLELHLKHERGPCNDLYGALLEALPLFSEFQIFVCSFSALGDTLSQWRGYCPNGIGCSIGFSPDMIKRQSSKQGFRLLRCVYDVDEQKAICEEVLTRACKIANEEKREELRRSAVVDNFFPSFMQIAAAIKNASFAEEQEWRLIGGPFAIEHPQIRFRAGKYAVIPYFEFELAAKSEILQFEQVLVGPNPDPAMSKQSVEYLLKCRNVRCNRIDGYKGTYRGW